MLLQVLNKDVNTTPPPKESNGLHRRAKARPPGNQAVTECAETSEVRDRGKGGGIRHPGATTEAYTEKKHGQIFKGDFSDRFSPKCDLL